MVSVLLAFGGRAFSLLTTALRIQRAVLRVSLASMSRRLLRSTVEFRAARFFLDTRLLSDPQLPGLHARLNRGRAVVNKNTAWYLGFPLFSAYALVLAFTVRSSQAPYHILTVNSVRTVYILVNGLIADGQSRTFLAHFKTRAIL